MNYDVYSHFPVLAVMCYFVGAFIVTLIGKRRAARNSREKCAVLLKSTNLVRCFTNT